MNKQEELVLKTKVTQLTQAGNYKQAEKICAYLANNLPQDAQIHFAFAQVLEKNGKGEAAASVYYKSAALDNSLAEPALSKAAKLCQLNGLLPEGYKAADTLTKLSPNNAEYRFLAGYFLYHLRMDYGAMLCLEKAIELGLKTAEGFHYYGDALKLIGRVDDAVEAYAKSSEIRRDSDVEATRLLALNYSDQLDDSVIYNMHCEHGDKIESKYAQPEKLQIDSAKSKIRVAYLSKDFVEHSVSYFFLPIIENFDASRFEVLCYSDATKSDYVTEKIIEQCSYFKDISSRSDEEVFKQIRQDQIDILVDLTGLTGSSRAGVYAQKPAPIQITYLGYPNTMGLSRIDYRLVDDKSDPVGLTEKITREGILRLPDSFLCYSPYKDSPPCNDLPAKENGVVTFGCFNVFAKVSPSTLSAWVEILKRVDNSRLVLKGRSFNDRLLKQELLSNFEREGISGDRVVFLDICAEIRDHLACYDMLDINLDTAPYNGTTTTCQAMWQGVPTIALAGNNHRSRVGVSILTAAGLSDWIAQSQEEYIQLAVDKAQDTAALADLRKGLREKMSNSPLMDGKLFSSNLEAMFEQLVEKHS